MAAPNVHLEIPPIKGDSKVDKYAEQVDCLSWSWGVSQAANMHQSTGGSAGASHVNDVVVVKGMDKSSSNFFHMCSTGKHFEKATLHCTKSAGDAGRIEWFTIIMERVVISSVMPSGGGAGDMGTESITLNFGKYTIKYAEQGADGAAKAGPEVIYDITEAKKV